MPKHFALIGVAGFIAPRHLRAIKDTGNTLIAALDRSDSVGVLDSYFPSADFFTEFERFDRHIELLKHEKNIRPDYVSICSPNYLHDAHIRFALRAGADAISEKPLVLNPWNLDGLAKIEAETGCKIYTILQLRLHPSIVALREQALKAGKNGKRDIDLTYITSRGHWYQYSWKGDISKSGGLPTNIGIHFFDMLTWIFGKPQLNTVHLSNSHKAAGFIEFERARVRWFLSVDRADLPAGAKGSTFRSLCMDGQEVEFSEGFTDLHTKSYQHIIEGKGFGIEDARASVNIAHAIRNAAPAGLTGDYHPLAANKVK